MASGMRCGQATQRSGEWGHQVTTYERPAQPGQMAAPRGYRKGSILADWLSTTDHKVIGHLYLITSFCFFLIAGAYGHDHAGAADGPR